jgi:hypothetical protein
MASNKLVPAPAAARPNAGWRDLWSPDQPALGMSAPKTRAPAWLHSTFPVPSYGQVPGVSCFPVLPGCGRIYAPQWRDTQGTMQRPPDARGVYDLFGPTTVVD